MYHFQRVLLQFVVSFWLITLLFPVSAFAQGILENPQPGAVLSGLTVFSGWVCEADRVDIEVDGIATQAAYGTTRADTSGVCVDDGNNGFGLLFNANLFGDGTHTARLLVTVGGETTEVARATFMVTTFDGQEFLSGVNGQAVVGSFPAAGGAVTVAWQESLQNFSIQQIAKTLQPGENIISGKFSGTVHSAIIDGDEDGLTAFVGTGTLSTANFGQVFVQSVFEVEVADPPTGTCPTEQTEFVPTEVELNRGRHVLTFPSGDQLFLQEGSRALCVDLNSAEFTHTATGSVGSEGDGAFAGTEGTFDIQSNTGFFPVADATLAAWGYFQGTMTLTLMVPEP